MPMPEVLVGVHPLPPSWHARGAQVAALLQRRQDARRLLASADAATRPMLQAIISDADRRIAKSRQGRRMGYGGADTMATNPYAF